MELFKIPQKAKIKQTIAIKRICEQSNLSTNDKSFILKNIKTITLIAELNENTVGLWSVKNDNESFESIYVFDIVLKRNESIKEIARVLHSIFPNHCIMILNFDGKTAISTALKRINKVDQSKTVIENISVAGWFKLDDLHTKLFNRICDKATDLKNLYNIINSVVCIEPYVNRFQKIPKKIDQDTILKSQLISQLTDKIEEFKLKKKTANSMKEQMEYHIKIKNIEREISNIKI